MIRTSISNHNHSIRPRNSQMGTDGDVGSGLARAPFRKRRDDFRVVRSAGVPAPPVIARRPAPRADAAIHLEPDRMPEPISWIATSLRSSR